MIRATAIISGATLLTNCALPPVDISPSAPVFFSAAGKRPPTPIANTDGAKIVRAVKEPIPSIKLVQNPLVQKWINYFQNKDPQRFQRALNRGYFYQNLVERTLAQSGLPQELYFLPLIESSYVSNARSPARAVGIWQFMPGTGRNYGLKVNRYVDERRDPVRASRAAVKYLRDLYTVFHSWELAMAAYNCGEYRVLRAIMKGDSRDFWLLGQRKLLPRETRNYVPKFIAAVLIGRNPEAFGFRHPRHLGLKRYPEIKAIEVPSPVSLTQVVKVTGWSMGLLKQLNPHLRRGRTPAGFKRYALWLPRSAILGQGQYALLQNQRLKRPLASPSAPGTHRVKSGENLTLIARRYRTSVARLSRLNGLSSSRLRVGQRLAVPGKAASAPSAASKYHLVKSGENLTLIARRHRTSVARLSRLNGLSSSRLRVGQRLAVSGKAAFAPSTASKYHLVKSGENLTLIARRYRLKALVLSRLNGLGSSRIYPGQKLLLQGAGSPRVYRVRRGDNLSLIAGIFGVSIRHIKSKNNLRTSRIYVGQKLRI